MIGRYMLIGGIMGALGIVSAAAAAHGHDTEKLASVSQILLVHGAVLVAIALHGSLTIALRLGAATLAFGATLFSADVALYVLKDTHLFSHAAPIGGGALIIGWLLLALSAFTLKGQR